MEILVAPGLVVLGLGDERQRGGEDSGISRPGNLHQTAGKPG